VEPHEHVLRHHRVEPVHLSRRRQWSATTHGRGPLQRTAEVRYNARQRSATTHSSGPLQRTSVVRYNAHLAEPVRPSERRDRSRAQRNGRHCRETDATSRWTGHAAITG
jgi:hypothetical protein